MCGPTLCLQKHCFSFISALMKQREGQAAFSRAQNSPHRQLGHLWPTYDELIHNAFKPVSPQGQVYSFIYGLGGSLQAAVSGTPLWLPAPAQAVWDKENTLDWKRHRDPPVSIPRYEQGHLLCHSLALVISWGHTTPSCLSAGSTVQGKMCSVHENRAGCGVRMHPWLQAGGCGQGWLQRAESGGARSGEAHRNSRCAGGCWKGAVGVQHSAAGRREQQGGSRGQAWSSREQLGEHRAAGCRREQHRAAGRSRAKQTAAASKRLQAGCSWVRTRCSREQKVVGKEQQDAAGSGGEGWD